MLLIDVYQTTLSPDHGVLRALFPYGYCRHEPTCSDYGKTMIRERGMIEGLPRLMIRLLRCHPWAKISNEKILAASRRQ